MDRGAQVSIETASIADLARDLAKAYIAYYIVIVKDGVKPVDFDAWMAMRQAMAQANG